MLDCIVELDFLITEVDVRHHMSSEDIIIIQNHR